MKILDLSPTCEKGKEGKFFEQFCSLIDNTLSDFKDFILTLFTRNVNTIRSENLNLHLADNGFDFFYISDENKREILKHATQIYQTKGKITTFKFLCYYVLGYDVDVVVEYAKMLDLSDDINSRSFDPNDSFMVDNLGTDNDPNSYSYENEIDVTKIVYTINNYDNDTDKLKKFESLTRKYMPTFPKEINY